MNNEKRTTNKFGNFATQNNFKNSLKRILSIVVTCYLLLVTSVLVQANTLPNSLRVGLLYNSTAAKIITVENGATITAPGLTFDYAINGYKTFEIIEDSLGNICIKTDASTTPISTTQLTITPSNNQFSLGSSKYRGQARAVKAGGFVNIVNIVSMDNYAYNVVPKEIGGGAPLEALKAQAVCARNYAATNMNKHNSQGFDLCNTVHCQVYGAIPALNATQEANLTNAINATSGKIATYGGQIAQLVYAASTGGWTEDVKNVWGSNFAYLSARQSPNEGGTNTYWTKTITQSGATSLLASHGLGTILDIEVQKSTTRAGSIGMVLELKITGTSGSKVLYSSPSEHCRTALGLNSQAYTIMKNSAGGTGGTTAGVPSTITAPSSVTVLSASGKSTLSGNISIVSSDGTTQRTITGTTIQGAGAIVDSGDISWTFTGRGWGHLVGMSQEGAMAMARAGKNYEEILKHYYTGITLQ